MGMDPEGRLAYGYRLGGDEDGWQVKEATGEFGDLELDWLANDDDGDGFAELAARRLRASTGFVEIPYGQPRPADYWDLSRAADQAVGVEVMCCGSSEYPAYVLCTKRYRVEWSDTEVLDLDLLAREVAEGDWDAKLARAVDFLGMTPIQERPGWLLCAYYG